MGEQAAEGARSGKRRASGVGTRKRQGYPDEAESVKI